MFNRITANPGVLRWSTAEMSLQRVEQELEDRTTLLGASRDHRPDPFAPPTAFLAPRPPGDVPVAYHKTNRPFRGVSRSSGITSWAGRLAQAVDTLEVAKDHPDSRALAFTLAGEALYKLQRFREADGILRAAVETEPSLTDAHRWLAALYYDIGAMDHALAELQVISEQAPDDPRPCRLRGLIYKDFEQEYERDAVHEYRESLRRGPDQPDRQQIRVELAECLVKQARFDEALETIGPCEKSPDVLAIQAQCHVGKGDKASARRLLGEALARDPNHLSRLHGKAAAAPAFCR